MTDTPGDAALRRVGEPDDPSLKAAISYFDGADMMEWGIRSWRVIKAALEANTRHTPEGGGLSIAERQVREIQESAMMLQQSERRLHEIAADISSEWIALMNLAKSALAQAAPQSGAPDAPPAHCPGCSGEHDDGYDARANCPGIAPAPPALSAEEREALEAATDWFYGSPQPEDATYQKQVRHLVDIRALLARTEAK